jgi:hypothetical protein
MNFATTKERIIQFIDFKGISITNFLKETGIKRGFLDTDKLKSSVSDVFLTMIIETYLELNLEWLITGKGEMLRENTLQSNDEKEKPNELIEAKNQIIELLKQENQRLKDEVAELKGLDKSRTA